MGADASDFLRGRVEAFLKHAQDRFGDQAAMVDDGELAPLYHEIEQAWVKKPFEVAESDKYAHGPVRAVAEILERHAE